VMAKYFEKSERRVPNQLAGISIGEMR